MGLGVSSLGREAALRLRLHTSPGHVTRHATILGWQDYLAGLSSGEAIRKNRFVEDEFDPTAM